MANINNLVTILFEMQSLEDMMQSYQQAIVTDPVKLAKLQMKSGNMINSLMQQDPGQVVDPSQLMDPHMQQDPNQAMNPNQDPSQVAGY